MSQEPPKKVIPPRPAPPISLERDAPPHEHFEATYQEAYQLIDRGITLITEGHNAQASVLLQKGLGLIDKALAIKIESFDCSAEKTQEYAEMQVKMRCTRKEVLEHFSDAQAASGGTGGRQQVEDAPPSYDDYLRSLESGASGSSAAAASTAGARAVGDNNIASYPTLSPDWEMVNNSPVVTPVVNAQQGEMILNIENGVQIFFILPDGTVTSPSYPSFLAIFTFPEPIKGIPGTDANARGFLQVGEWSYPLVPAQSPVLHSFYGAYMFPNFSSSEAGSSVGVILPDTVDKDTRVLFEQILTQMTSYQKQAPPSEEAATAVKESTAERIAAGAEAVSKGVVWGAAKLSELISFGSESLKEYVPPATEKKEIDPKWHKTASVARDVSGKAVKVSGYLLSQVGKATMALGRKAAPHLQRHGTKAITHLTGQTEKEASSNVDGVMEVAAGAVKGASTIYMGLESAAATLATSLTDSTVKVVTHRYGEEVGSLTDNTLYAVGQTAWAGHNIASLGVKGVAKRAAKDTGKALVLQHEEKKKAGQGVEEAEEAMEQDTPKEEKQDAEQPPVRPVREKKAFPLKYCKRTYNELWAKTQEDLIIVLEKDHALQGTFHPEQRSEVSSRVRCVYVQYLSVARRLNTCHDLLLHAQRRQLLRQMLNSTLGRIVELKHELVGLELTDTVHCDDVMVELNLSPEDLLVPVPAYVRRDRLPIIQERNALIDDCLRRAGLEAVSEDEALPLSVPEAILLLQRHERAKQGRARADHRRDMLARQERDRGRGRQQLSMEAAVVRLQAVTRGMLARRRVRQMRFNEELFLGLRPDPTLDRSWGAKLRKVELARYKVQEERERELEDTEKRIQTRILYEEGTHLLTSMEDKIREWVFQKKNETGKFPDLPEEEEGGSSAIVGLVPPDEDATSEDARSLAEKKSERERVREQAKQKKKKEEEERSICLRPSSYVASLQTACDQYQDVWAMRQPEENPEERAEEDMIEAEQRARVEVEIRRQVDYLMRQEIQRLKEDVEGEKRGAKKKKRVKKGGKKGRKRKEKDLTPDRTTESLFEELVLNGIIKKVPEGRLQDLLGDVNLVGTEVLAKTKYPQPDLGDIKNSLIEYIVLPLGVDEVHEGTTLVKSVLVVGPRGCGKTQLVQAVAYEAGATFMDLTATNIVGRYPGRAGLNMLTHLVMKVGRLLQPTLVMVDCADKMFMKKVPKTDKSDPRRLKKEMPKMLKSIASEDRIVFVGITNSPWNCDVKSLSSVYQKILMVPRPTFSARAHLWRNLLTMNGAKITHRMDISGLARISDGYTSGHICSVVSQVVTEQRLAKQNKNPLTAEEFVVPLSKLEPIYREEEEAMKAWFQRTALMRKRARLLEEEAEAQGLKGKAAKKSEVKKPKGKKGKKKKKK